MKPINCPNCKEPLIENILFCSNCGAPINENENNIPNNDFATLINKKPNSFKKMLKIIAGIMAICVLFLVIKFVIPDFDDTQRTFSLSFELEQIEGKWQDPTGTLLGDQNTIINLSKKGDIVVGKDDNEFIKMQLIPVGSNNYSGIVNLRGVESDFEVHFYEEENKLVFFSTLTKTSWNIKRIKD